MGGVLLDTHAFYWLASGAETLTPTALVAIGESQMDGLLHISPISSWELALAVRKPNNAPQLDDADVGRWFRRAARSLRAKTVPVGARIAVEAARVAALTGHRDPGDCFLVATARIRKLVLVSRDRVILRMSAEGVLSAVEC